jgi:tRNA (uracil-5-)-methyltransferase TRM9
MPTLREVYDKIAPGRYNVQHWTRFQHELEEMAARWKNGRLLNLGCGHGSDFLAFKDNFKLYGVDFSSVMLEMAGKFAKKFDLNLDLVQGDVSRIPFKDETFDWAISVATYHHLETPEARLRAFTELKRILKPGGEAFVTVWNRWRPQRDCSVLRFWFLGREADVPWRKGDETLSRYYYFFTYSELEKLARQAGFQILRSFPENSYSFPLKYFSRNICLLVKKSGPISSGHS